MSQTVGLSVWISYEKASRASQCYEHFEAVASIGRKNGEQSRPLRRMEGTIFDRLIELAEEGVGETDEFVEFGWGV